MSLLWMGSRDRSGKTEIDADDTLAPYCGLYSQTIPSGWPLGSFFEFYLVCNWTFLYESTESDFHEVARSRADCYAKRRRDQTLCSFARWPSRCFSDVEALQEMDLDEPNTLIAHKIIGL